MAHLQHLPPGRIWKFVGMIHSRDMLAVSYAMQTIDGDLDREGEERLMGAAFTQVMAGGPGLHVVQCMRRTFVVQASRELCHPIQGCPPPHMWN